MLLFDDGKKLEKAVGEEAARGIGEMMERTLEAYVKYFGVPEDILRSPEEVAEIQQAKNEAENKYLST